MRASSTNERGPSQWSDLGPRALTIAVAVPLVVAIVVFAPPIAWAGVTAVALAIAGAECFTLLLRAEGSDRRGPFKRWLFVCFTIFYCGILPAHVALIRYRDGSAWTLLALALPWGSDAGAYLGGKLLRGPRLAPRVSPSKTIAGSLAGLITAALIGAVFARLSSDGAHTGRIVAIAVVAGVLSQVGDLLESRLKRRCGAKDSGVAIPGHGGMLDCIDGLILAAPWLYYARHYLM